MKQVEELDVQTDHEYTLFNFRDYVRDRNVFVSRFGSFNNVYLHKDSEKCSRGFRNMRSQGSGIAGFGEGMVLATESNSEPLYILSLEKLHCCYLLVRLSFSYNTT